MMDKDDREREYDSVSPKSSFFIRFLLAAEAAAAVSFIRSNCHRHKCDFLMHPLKSKSG
jgi:hypothetical protein